MSAFKRSSRLDVERERFRLEDFPRRVARYDDQRAGDAVPGLMRQLGLADSFWMQALEREWPQLVGVQVARRTRPGRFNRGVLYVYVTGAPWLAELTRMGQKPMLANVQARFGADRIKSIRLQIDPGE